MAKELALSTNPEISSLVVEARFKRVANLPEGIPKCAWIVLGSGRSTKAFHSRWVGNQIIAFLYKNGYIVDDEESSLRAALGASELKEYHPLDDEPFFVEGGILGDSEIFPLPPIYLM